ncbi:glycosyltransferase family 2 protein [Bacillus sp. EB01]|uniref:glycosyltransferase family 2 protein n=1 Tax=Bacillus sp. EB01 TaxID=1347086 RepID=UPI0006935BFF|nr:glycosyltransferase family 2 protein [Bacillus sp. EB01]
MTVSIIIPIYNGELFLAKCIESVMNQTYDDIEIILINDGSTDNSITICESYQKMDKRIRVFDRPNSGVSDTRNFGISVSSGEYIQFVDCDDSISNDMTEALVAEIQYDQSELAISGYKIMDLDDNLIEEIRIGHGGCIDKSEFFNLFGEFFEKKGLLNSPCNKMYVKKIIVDNNILFPKDFSLGEDLLFNLKYMETIDSISLIDQSFYSYYRVNNQSLTLKYNSKRLEAQEFIYQELRKFMAKYGVYQSRNKIILESKYIKAITDAMISFLLNDKMAKEEKRRTIKNIVNTKQFNDSLKLAKLNLKYKLFIFLLQSNFVSLTLQLLNLKKKINSVVTQ